MTEDFYYEENNSKHIFIKCLIILFILGLSIGIFLFYKKEHTLKLKNITIEVGEQLSKNVNDYIINGNKYIDEYKLYINEVDIYKVGEYTYKVKYNKHTKKGIIKVVDKTKPEVTVNNITIGINEELNPDELLMSCKDNSLPCRVELSKSSDLKKLKVVGTHEIEIIVSDNVGNITKSIVQVTVSETETLSSLQTEDLNYYTNSENDDKIEHILFHKLDKALNEETLEYEGLIQEISSIDFSEYISDKEIYDTKLITAYNKYGYVIGIQVLVTFTDGSTKLLEK